MIWLTDKIEFPPYELTTDEGIIALGGDLSEKRLIFAYQNGIFPWFSEGDPIIWYCPHKRINAWFYTRMKLEFLNRCKKSLIKICLLLKKTKRLKK